jgi:hypothetical protein
MPELLASGVGRILLIQSHLAHLGESSQVHRLHRPLRVISQEMDHILGCRIEVIACGAPEGATRPLERLTILWARQNLLYISTNHSSCP